MQIMFYVAMGSAYLGRGSIPPQTFVAKSWKRKTNELQKN